MTKPSPTRIGDVLILRTGKTFTVYVVGLVRRHGQDDFHGQPDATHVTSHTAAVTAAKALAVRERHIHLLDIDTHTWSEISA